MNSQWFQKNVNFNDRFKVPVSHYQTSASTYGSCYTDPVVAQSLQSNSTSRLTGRPSATYLPATMAKTAGTNGKSIANHTSGKGTMLPVGEEAA